MQMAYAPITKLEKFTGEENNTQIWLNDVTKTITANNWDDTRALQAIPYFLQDTTNSWYQSLINKLVIFDAFKTEGLHSNILQHMCLLHPADFQAVITNARDFEATELETNYVQASLGSCQQSSGTGYTPNPSSQNYLSLLVTPEDALFNKTEPNQSKPLISNISLATIMEDELLAAIFPFKIKKLSKTLLFNGTALEEKLITMMYTNAKVNGHFIKLILNSGSAGSIITRQLMNQLGHQVD
ncbi:hypothetical protein G9A89_006102 [Geosiphon pyriformis]|nr:hypothetical protein G9A89_006102 [Geosiphon pyriformis]